MFNLIHKIWFKDKSLFTYFYRLMLGEKENCFLSPARREHFGIKRWYWGL